MEVNKNMEGKGTRIERETIINFNEDDEEASIWTASETVYRRLIKIGYVPHEDNERSAAFKMPKRDIRLPRPKRQVTEAQREAGKRLREAILSQEAKENPGDEES
jgi:hypothetical protein